MFGRHEECGVGGWGATVSHMLNWCVCHGHVDPAFFFRLSAFYRICAPGFSIMLALSRPKAQRFLQCLDWHLSKNPGRPSGSTWTNKFFSILSCLSSPALKESSSGMYFDIWKRSMDRVVFERMERKESGNPAGCADGILPASTCTQREENGHGSFVF